MAMVETNGKQEKTPRTSVKMGKYELKYEPYLDDIYMEKARRELRETPENVALGQKEIRMLVRDEPDLIVPDDDEFFQKFLRPCKWYAKSAFELMKRYYRFQQNYHRLCHNMVPTAEKNVFLSGVFMPLPLRMSDGCRVLIVEGGKSWNPKQVSTDELFKVIMLALMAAMSEPNTQIAGVHVIIDMDGLPLGHVTYFTPSFAAMVAEWVQKCVPCRTKGIHIVNQPFIFNMIFALFKPFLQEKTRRRIHFHGTNRESLLSKIDAKVLPTKYGGEFELPNESLAEQIWHHFCEFEEDFKVSNSYGYVGNSK